MKKFFRVQAWEIYLVSCFIILYALGASLVSLNRFWQFDAFWYDFGIFDETVWKWSRLQLPIIPTLAPPLGKIVWADHFNPTIVLLAPVYWLTSRPETILIVQAVVVGLSGWVIYRLTRKLIRSTVVRLSLVASYLMFVGLQNALYTDVHNIVFALLPFTLTIWADYEKRKNLYWLFLLLTLGIQENLSAIGIGWGLFLIFRKQEWRRGILTLIISLIWGLIAISLIIPYFNHGTYNYQPDWPLHWYEWFTRFFLPLDLKGKTIFLTLATFGFLPLFSLATYPLIILHFLERFVLNSAATRWDLGFHYNALLSPIMFLATLDVLMRLQKQPGLRKYLQFWAGATLLGVVFLHRFYLHGPLLLATHPTFYAQTQRAQFLEKFINQIPRQGLLMTQNNLAAHFTHANVTLLNLNIGDIKPAVVAIDRRPGQNPNDFYPLTNMQVEQLVASLSANQVYKPNHLNDSQLIFERIPQAN